MPESLSSLRCSDMSAEAYRVSKQLVGCVNIRCRPEAEAASSNFEPSRGRGLSRTPGKVFLQVLLRHLPLFPEAFACGRAKAEADFKRL